MPRASTAGARQYSGYDSSALPTTSFPPGAAPARPETPKSSPIMMEAFGFGGEEEAGPSGTSGCGRNPRPILKSHNSAVHTSSPLRRQVGFDDENARTPRRSQSAHGMRGSPALYTPQWTPGRTRVSFASEPQSYFDQPRAPSIASEPSMDSVHRRPSMGQRTLSDLVRNPPNAFATRSPSMSAGGSARPESLASRTSTRSGLWSEDGTPPHPSTALPGIPSVNEFSDLNAPKFSRQALRRGGVVLPTPARPGSVTSDEGGHKRSGSFSREGKLAGLVRSLSSKKGKENPTPLVHRAPSVPRQPAVGQRGAAPVLPRTRSHPGFNAPPGRYSPLPLQNRGQQNYSPQQSFYMAPQAAGHLAPQPSGAMYPIQHPIQVFPPPGPAAPLSPPLNGTFSANSIIYVPPGGKPPPGAVLYRPPPGHFPFPSFSSAPSIAPMPMSMMPVPPQMSPMPPRHMAMPSPQLRSPPLQAQRSPQPPHQQLHRTGSMGQYQPPPQLHRTGSTGQYQPPPQLHRTGSTGQYQPPPQLHRAGSMGPPPVPMRTAMTPPPLRGAMSPPPPPPRSPQNHRIVTPEEAAAARQTLKHYRSQPSLTGTPTLASLPERRPVTSTQHRWDPLPPVSPDVPPKRTERAMGLGLRIEPAKSHGLAAPSPIDDSPVPSPLAGYGSTVSAPLAPAFKVHGGSKLGAPARIEAASPAETSITPPVQAPVVVAPTAQKSGNPFGFLRSAPKPPKAKASKASSKAATKAPAKPHISNPSQPRQFDINGAPTLGRLDLGGNLSLNVDSELADLPELDELPSLALPDLPMPPPVPLSLPPRGVPDVPCTPTSFAFPSPGLPALPASPPLSPRSSPSRTSAKTVTSTRTVRAAPSSPPYRVEPLKGSPAASPPRQHVPSPPRQRQAHPTTPQVTRQVDPDSPVLPRKDAPDSPRVPLKDSPEFARAPLQDMPTSPQVPPKEPASPKVPVTVTATPSPPRARTAVAQRSPPRSASADAHEGLPTLAPPQVSPQSHSVPSTPLLGTQLLPGAGEVKAVPTVAEPAGSGLKEAARDAAAVSPVPPRPARSALRMMKRNSDDGAPFALVTPIERAPVCLPLRGESLAAATSTANGWQPASPIVDSSSSSPSRSNSITHHSASRSNSVSHATGLHSRTSSSIGHGALMSMRARPSHKGHTTRSPSTVSLASEVSTTSTQSISSLTSASSAASVDMPDPIAEDEPLAPVRVAGSTGSASCVTEHDDWKPHRSRSGASTPNSSQSHHSSYIPATQGYPAAAGHARSRSEGAGPGEMETLERSDELDAVLPGAGMHRRNTSIRRKPVPKLLEEKPLADKLVVVV